METAYKSYERIYKFEESCVFRKTKEQFGGLSNMASGFLLKINDIPILTSEALYQACRYPHMPDVQKKIIDEKSPMSSKMAGKPFRAQSRSDWDEVRVKIMRWCLRVKLAQNFIEFGKVLESTTIKPIVEDSSKDDFWGAIRDKNNPSILRGVNALGRLLMELRQNYNDKRYSYDMFEVEPLDIPDFKLFGNLIEKIDERQIFINTLRHSLKYFEFDDVNVQKSKYDDIKFEPTKSIINEESVDILINQNLKDPERSKKGKDKKRKDKYIGQTTLPF